MSNQPKSPKAPTEFEQLTLTKGLLTALVKHPLPAPAPETRQLLLFRAAQASHGSLEVGRGRG